VYRRRYADVLFDERSINPHDASNPVPTQAQVEATSDDYVELQPSTPTQLDSPPTSSTTSDATVGPNLDSNSNVSLDGQLDGKEFMRISTDLRVTEVARIFDCSPSNYLKFVKAKYDGDWITKLNSKSTLVEGTDVPIYRNIEKASKTAATSNGSKKTMRKRRSQRKISNAALAELVQNEDDLETEFDDCMNDAIRYQTDKKNGCQDFLRANAATTTAGNVATPHTMIDTPKNRKAAMNSGHWNRWEKAEAKEWAGLWESGTFEDWKISDVPKGFKLHFMNWIYKCKTEKDKARLTFDGRRQDPNSYGDVYSPTARMESLRIMLALAAKNNWKLMGDDVAQAFLYAKRPTDKPIWAAYPAGHRKEGHCVKIIKYLYGLHDSPLAFWKLVRQHMVEEQGFEQSTADRCVFIKKVLKTNTASHTKRPTKRQRLDDTTQDPRYDYCFVRVHVDDFLSTGDDNLLADFRQRLRQRFKVTGEPAKMHYGLDIDRHLGCVRLSARTYLKRKLKELGLEKVTAYSTPMAPHISLPKMAGPCTNPKLHTRYRSMIGALTFPAMTCRPDIAAATHLLSKHLVHPTAVHMAAAERVFGYLRSTANDGIIFGKDDKLVFYGTSDASHAIVQAAAGWPPTLGVTGYHFQLYGGPVAWRSSAQKLTSHSSTEAELYALDEATRELVYLQKLLKDFDVQHLPHPVTIGQDNVAAITLSNADQYNPRTKHIAIRYMYINDMQKQGDVLVSHCDTDSIPSDALTKPLFLAPFKKHTDVLMGRVPLKWTSRV
jgi:hypothetical protein